MANGNHDKVNQEAVRGYCHVFDQHDNVLVADDTISLLASKDWDFVLHIIPYFPENGSFIEKLDKLIADGLDKKRKNYLYIHEGVNGALSQSNEKELSPNVFSIFDKVFVGHYHNRCTIDGTNVEYIGSSRQHNFGEDEEKGYTVIYPDGHYDFIKNQVNTRYLVMDVPVEKQAYTYLTNWKKSKKTDVTVSRCVYIHPVPKLQALTKKNCCRRGPVRSRL